MVLKLHNTLTRATDPIDTHDVRMYHCGPTVYDFAHIGNLRTFIMNDILRRSLEYTGHSVKQVMNITDIDDKMIARAHEQGVTIHTLAHEYENFLFADFKALNILTPHIMPRATEHIGGMIAMIEKLLRDGFAYKASDGVYFEVAKSKDYGALAHLDLDAETESRVDGAVDKKSPRDFALWKFESPEDYGNAYDASFGRGRPGWHIECSEMARDTLGETIDIHTGGVDLIFPHHTNEIAQSEAFNGKQFVKTWAHAEFMMIDGDKMSKSLGNIITMKTIIDRGFSPISFRYFVLGADYRSKLNFTWDALEGSEKALKKLQKIVLELPDGGKPDENEIQSLKDAISNNLHTPWIIARTWEILKDEPGISLADKKATILEFDRILGLGLSDLKKDVIPVHIEQLAISREEARKNKEWVKSDKIRDEINSLGYEILDTDNGPELRRK